MKAVILAGGFGTRISEESVTTPKPMVEIGGRPILWHIMKIYSHYGVNDFVICLGYKAHVIKEYFFNYHMHRCDMTINVKTGACEYLANGAEPWNITLIDTGLDTMTGGRLRRIAPYVQDGPFCMTYGDGLSTVDIGALIAFHKEQGRTATVTAIREPSRFGVLDTSGAKVREIREKSAQDGALINGGFFVLEPEALNYIDGDDTVWEREPMESIAAAGEMSVYVHNGFWRCMDTLRDRNQLEDMWRAAEAPWRLWAA
ncbi:MAG: glucose-1-phosphate cytidylyltransferase [Pseudomonadota bacterium]